MRAAQPTEAADAASATRTRRIAERTTAGGAATEADAGGEDGSVEAAEAAGAAAEELEGGEEEEGSVPAPVASTAWLGPCER
jgi:hypothetical protein